jgi:NADPH:quinone reductase-like Zn-dependent oxidoreductase
LRIADCGLRIAIRIPRQSQSTIHNPQSAIRNPHPIRIPQSAVRNMKAIVHHAYGSADVLRLEDVPIPVPEAGEVVIRVRAASVNPLDWHFMRGLPYFVRIMTGLRRPKSPRLGVDVAGEVEVVGRGVTRLKPGDEVFGACRGAFAEYAAARESRLAVKPKQITFEQAASVPIAAGTALHALRDAARLQPGHSVLINGAAGGVGTFAVQIARAFGGEVAGVCSSKNADMVRAIGAERVIDYTTDDFTKSGGRYQVIVDCIGNHPMSAIRRVLTPDGTYVGVGAPAGRWMVGALAQAVAARAVSAFSRQTLTSILGSASAADFTVIAELIASGRVTPVIDSRHGLREVAAALGYLESGHARGKVVIVL